MAQLIVLNLFDQGVKVSIGLYPTTSAELAFMIRFEDNMDSYDEITEFGLNHSQATDLCHKYMKTLKAMDYLTYTFQLQHKLESAIDQLFNY